MFKKWLIIFVLLSNIFLLSCESDSTSSSDTEEPTVSILYPPDSSRFFEGDLITIRAEASDNQEIKKVEFFIDGNNIAIFDSLPYEYSWNTGGQPDMHTIKAKTVDFNNNEGKSDPVSITIIATGTVNDIDGKEYKTVKIGEQWWMAENLAVTYYNNGDPIPYVSDDTLWSLLDSGAFCKYEYLLNEEYGRLYNWFAATDDRKIAPVGWHVPTDDEWKQLEMYLGMSQSEADRVHARGTNQGGRLKEAGNDHWESPNAYATNETGFTALPGGWRRSTSTHGYFAGLRESAFFWSSTDLPGGTVWNRRLFYFDPYVSRDETDKRNGLSIRCVKD
jgi:uncharacterized protein (TIGR02145 family)